MKNHFTLAAIALALSPVLVPFIGCKAPTVNYRAPDPPDFTFLFDPQETVSILPSWESVQLGQPLTLQAIVTGYPPGATNLTFQWEWNKDPYATNAWTTNQTWMQLKLAETNWTSLPGSINSNIFTVFSASTNTVAFYRVKVFAPGGQTNVSAFAPVWVWLKGKPPKSVWKGYGQPGYLHAKHHSVCVLGTVVHQQGGGPAAQELFSIVWIILVTCRYLVRHHIMRLTCNKAPPGYPGLINTAAPIRAVAVAKRARAAAASRSLSHISLVGTGSRFS